MSQAADDLPYQAIGAAHLASKERGALLDDPGLGKSRQAILALDKKGLKRGLIVAPAAVRQVWADEIKKWSTLPRRVIKGRDIQDLNLWLRGRVDVLLLSYEMATAWAKRMEVDVFDFIIFDESHYLKSSSAQRTQALLGAKCDGSHGLARWATHCWFLTGTCSPNDAADVWTMLRFCRATPLGHKIFTDRYFTKKTGAFSTLHTPREAMIPEFKQVWKSVALRRTKKDVNLQLPPIWLTTTTVEGDTSEIKALLRGHPGLDKAILQAVDKGGLSFLDAQHVATLRRLVGEAKAPAFAELLLEELNNGLGKVVVFGIHRRALDILDSHLRKRGFDVVRIDGGTTDLGRTNAVESFQRDDGARVFLGNIRAAGSGLTLTAAHDIIMFEQEWSPAANSQALMRVHRIGQKHAVHARFIILSDSIDEQVAATVASKTKNLIRLGTFSDEFSS